MRGVFALSFPLQDHHSVMCDNECSFLFQCLRSPFIEKFLHFQLLVWLKGGAIFCAIFLLFWAYGFFLEVLFSAILGSSATPTHSFCKKNSIITNSLQTKHNSLPTHPTPRLHTTSGKRCRREATPQPFLLHFESTAFLFPFF